MKQCPQCRAEAPVDEHNHALAALRYLIATIDRRRLGRRPVGTEAEAKPTNTAAQDQARRYWELAFSDDEMLWRPMG